MKTPITPIRMPLDLKARIKKRESNVSWFVISAVRDRLDQLDEWDKNR